MEGEIEWKTTEEEEVAEDVGGGLEIRQRKKGEMVKEREVKVVNGEENSVYFEADKGVWKCRHCTWTYHLSGPAIDLTQKHEGNCQVVIDVETLTRLGTYIDSPIKGADVGDATVGLESGKVDKFVAERNLQNGKADIGAREFNDHKNVPIEETHRVKNAVSENGSKSYLSSESSNGITRKESEIQESEKFKPGNSSNVIVKEFDVERVIEEQETHDLFCPNCHSCITKRVILRKRKRLYREIQSDLPPEEVQHVTEVNSAPSVSAPSVTADLEDEPVFRCLSCFSFFIPTESGFNIFRIFGKRDGSTDLQSSAKIPARKVNWVTSLFGSGSSKDKGREAGVPLLAESTIESGSVSSRDPSLGLKQKFPHVPTLGSADIGDKGSSTGMNNSGVPLLAESTVESGSVSSRDPSLGLKQKFPHVPTLGSADLGDQGSSTGMNNADLPAGANEGQGDKESYTGPTISEGYGTDRPDVLVKPPFLEGTLPSNGDTYTSMPPAAGYSTPVNNINKPASPIPQIPATVETILDVGVQGIEESRRGNEWDVLKSIVYGGLMESIASLSVVSSAAGSGSSTLNICALGLANLIGGLFVIAHDLSELRSENDTQSTNPRYFVKLGKRENFRRHVVISILSYIIFGLLPPVIYGFTFRNSDNKEYKLIAVAASSMLGVAVLAICKAHVRPEKGYIKSLSYYIGLVLLASGLCYIAGVMVDRLLVELGLFDRRTVSPSPPTSVEFIGFGST